MCWGYPYPWQDVGFFAPRDFPNRVVTSFVGQALLDGYETLQRRSLPRRRRARGPVPARRPEDAVRGRRPLVPQLRARPEPSTGSSWTSRRWSGRWRPGSARSPATLTSSARAAGSSATWSRSRPTTAPGSTPSRRRPATSPTTTTTPASSSTRSCSYGLATGSDEFESAYHRGIEFYDQRLFEPDGAARFMSDRALPDRHPRVRAGGHHVLAPAAVLRRRRRRPPRRCCDGRWTTCGIRRAGGSTTSGAGDYRTRIRELRWCQGWMSWALASYLENCGGEA